MTKILMNYPFATIRALRGLVLILLAGIGACIAAISTHAQTREMVAAAGETAKTVGSMDTAHLLALICVVLLGALCFVCWLNVRIGFRAAVDIAKIQTTQEETLQRVGRLRCSRSKQEDERLARSTTS